MHLTTDIVKIEHYNPSHAEYVVLNWCLGNTCNFSCSYCPEDLHSGTNPWPQAENVLNFLNQFIAHYSDRKKYIEFTGGEVTLWKDMPMVCEYLKEYDCKVGVISNGSRTLEFWQKFVKNIDHVCLSFHSEKGNTDHFFKVVQFLADKIRVHVNIMMNPDKFDILVPLAYKVVNEIPNISIAIQPLVHDFGDVLFNYTEEQKKIIDDQNNLFVTKIQKTKEYEYYRGAMNQVFSDGSKKVIAPQRLISSQQNNWAGWDCLVGLEQLVVSKEGNVSRAWCGVGGNFATIYQDQVSFPSAPIKCTKKFCHCNLDIMATKIKKNVQ